MAASALRKSRNWPGEGVRPFIANVAQSSLETGSTRSTGAQISSSSSCGKGGCGHSFPASSIHGNSAVEAGAVCAGEAGAGGAGDIKAGCESGFVGGRISFPASSTHNGCGILPSVVANCRELSDGAPAAGRGSRNHVDELGISRGAGNSGAACGAISEGNASQCVWGKAVLCSRIATGGAICEGITVGVIMSAGGRGSS